MADQEFAEAVLKTQRIVPYLYYEDGVRALTFLEEAFGFEERMRVARDDGTIMHAEIGYDGQVVMLGTPVDAEGNPKPQHFPERHSSVLCYVDDVDAHYTRAQAAGATIVTELADEAYGARTYTAADPEGHHWHFHTPL